MCDELNPRAPASGEQARQTMIVPDEAEFTALLARARGGSKEALVEAVDIALPFAKPSARYLLRQAVRSCSASDHRQSLYLAVLTHFDAFRGESFASFAGWLATILANRQIDSFRSARANKRGGGQVEYLGDRDVVDRVVNLKGADPVVSEAIERENRRRLDRALAGLPDRERAIIVMRYLLDLSFKSIGQALDESSDAVRVACSRTIRKLRRALGEECDAGSLAPAG